MSSLKFTFKETNISTNSHDSDDNDINESNTSKFTTDSIVPKVESKVEHIPPKEVPPITMRVMHFCREFAIFCLMVVTYATLTKDSSIISKAPAAYQFFKKGDFVTDWYRGEISKAIESARTGDIAFIMFYAPWDAESQVARTEFEIAAEYTSEYVNFAAVNCWQPYSECRNQYSKVYKWPVFIAYLAHGRGVQYGGPISAFHMIQFLKKVCSPFSLMTKDHPKDFEDAYIVAELNTSPGNLDFAVFYSIALKYLEKDPQYRISFYVKSTVIESPRLYLHLWNETLKYPIQEPWTPNDILHWIITNMHQMTAWVSPYGSKSVTISSSMSNGVALVLFTPKNALHIGNDYYSMLQEIAQEYYNCNEDISVNSNSMDIKLKRLANLWNYKELRVTCGLDISNYKLLSHNVIPFWINISNQSQNRKQHRFDILEEPNSCDICFKPIISSNADDETSCGSENIKTKIYKTSLLTGVDDFRSAKNLNKTFHKVKCKQFSKAEKLQPAIFEKVGMTEKTIDIRGLSCRSNGSLSLLSMDSFLNYPFAQRLGIDLSKFADKSAVVILNEKMESHYILKGPINGVSLREFIMNYTLNNLNRSFESRNTLNITKEQQSSSKTIGSEIIIHQLDSNSFLPIILQENKAIAVFYYSKQCSFCNGISYIYLTVAKKLSLVKDLIFTRIDGDLNILPWEYSMESYPTFLFLPNKKKSESRVFPSSMPITVSNLTGFILTNLEPEMKLEAIWSLCRQTKFAKERSSCYSTLLGEILSYIDVTLKSWRKSNKRQQQVLLHRLKHLRQLHLLFAHHPEQKEVIQNYFRKLNNIHHNWKGDYRGSSKTLGLRYNYS